MIPTLFSVSYAGLWGQDKLDLPEFIRKATQLGFKGVMFMGKRPHLAPLDYAPERVAELKALMDQAGIACTVVGGYTDFSAAQAAEVPWLEIQIAYVESLARLAQGLGAGIVRVFTAYESPAVPLATIWNRTVTGLRESSDRAAAVGVTLAVQNHHDLAVHSEVMLELLSDINRANCKLGYDAWSPALRGEDLYQTARRMAPHTVLTTNADYVRLPRFRYQPELTNYTPAAPDLVRAVPFGQGFIDYRAFFSGLREGGFNGVASYEMCSPLRGGGTLDNLDACARGYLAWMRENGFISS
jgi:sugar phosphate isomerase/epimerase